MLVFHRSLNVNKSLQVSRTLPSNLADLNNAAVEMLTILPLISIFISHFQSLSEPFQVHQLKVVSLSSSRFTVLFLVLD